MKRERKACLILISSPLLVGPKPGKTRLIQHFQYVLNPFRVDKADSLARFSLTASSFRTDISRRPKGETVCLLFIFSTNPNAFVANDMTCLFFTKRFHHCCHGFFFSFFDLCPSHHRKVRRSLRAKKLARVGPDHGPFWAHVGRFYNRKHETPPDGDGME